MIRTFCFMLTVINFVAELLVVVVLNTGFVASCSGARVPVLLSRFKVIGLLACRASIAANSFVC